MTNKLPKILTATLLALLTTAIAASVILAQDLPAGRQDAVQINIAPARQELVADPGETTAVNVRLYNPTSNPITGNLGVVDFIVERDDGVPTFLEQNEVSPRFAAAAWVNLPYDKVIIPSKESVTIQAKINIPQAANAGGRYFAIYFEHGRTSPDLSDQEDKDVAVTHRIVSLTYLTITGPVDESALLKELKAPAFLEYGPITATSEITNQGDLHIRPQGTITLTNMFGKIVDQQSLEGKNVFPDASRIYENILAQNQRWLIGKYRIDLSATYGDGGQVIKGTVFTWVFPWKLVTMIILAIVIISLLIVITIRSFRKKEEQLEEKIEQLEEKLNNNS